MAEFPKMPLWTDAYLADTYQLTTTEHGAYLLLLIAMWRAKDQKLPADDKSLAKFARMTTTQWTRIKPSIFPFFTEADGFITQGRLTDEASAVRQHSRKQSDKVKARWRKTKDKADTAVLPDENRSDTSLSLSPSHTVVVVAARGREADSFLGRIVAAVGLNPSDRLPAHWMPPAADLHIRRWLTDLGLSEAECEQVAAAERRNHAEPPGGPKALDHAMRRFAAAKAAPALTPHVNGGSGSGPGPPAYDVAAAVKRALAGMEQGEQ